MAPTVAGAPQLLLPISTLPLSKAGSSLENSMGSSLSFTPMALAISLATDHSVDIGYHQLGNLYLGCK